MIKIILFDSFFNFFEAHAVMLDEKTGYYVIIFRDFKAVFELRSPAPPDGHFLNRWLGCPSALS